MTARSTNTGPGRKPPAPAGLMIGSLMLGAMAYGVLSTVLVPALPMFQHVMHASETGVTWLLTAFLLAGAAATTMVGRLGDMFGRRRVLLVTLAVLAAGTLVSALSSSLGPQIAGRVLQGVACGLFPLAFGIIRDELPPHKVAGGIGAVTAMISVGAVGVILPGLVVPHLGWHWLYWIPLILTLASLAGTAAFIRESPARPGGRINFTGAALMTTGITATVLAISEGGQWGWAAPGTLALLVGGLALSAAWILADLRASAPLVNLSLLRLRGVWTTNIVAFMVGAGMFSAFAVYPIFAQLPASTGFGYGASVLQCGLYLLPFAVASGALSMSAGRLARKIGTVTTLAAGCLIVTAAFAAMAAWHASPWQMMTSLGAEGLGLGMVFPTMATAYVRTVPARNVGEVAGINTVVRMIGGAVGTQVVTSLITSHHHNGLPALQGFVASYITLAAFMVIAAIGALLVPSTPRPGQPNPQPATPAGHQTRTPLATTGQERT